MIYRPLPRPLGGMADAGDLKSPDFGCPGSTPGGATEDFSSLLHVSPGPSGVAMQLNISFNCTKFWP